MNKIEKHEYTRRQCSTIFYAFYREFVRNEDEEDGKLANPLKAAKDVKKALESWVMIKTAAVGAKKPAQVTEILGKGVGGIASKAFCLWSTKDHKSRLSLL